MIGKKYKREDCVRLLLSKRQALAARGIDRLPRRSDFENDEVVAIKAFLGPWPRALEKAGIKEPREEGGAGRNGEARRRARGGARETPARGTSKREKAPEAKRDE